MNKIQRDRHCSSCGAAFPEPLVYPRTCAACGFTVWANPIPVSVVLVPVHTARGPGLLTVRRSIEPGKGRLALAGGFLEEHETWQQGGARELLEEVNVPVDPAQLRPLWFVSTEPRPNRVLLFSVAPEQDVAALPPFSQNDETQERGVVHGPEGLDEIFAFPLHAQAARMWFASQCIAGSADYEVV